MRKRIHLKFFLLPVYLVNYYTEKSHCSQICQLLQKTIQKVLISLRNSPLISFWLERRALEGGGHLSAADVLKVVTYLNGSSHPINLKL